MTNKKIVWAIAVLALIVGLGVGYFMFHSSKLGGAISSMLAEDYIPYLRTNGGYYSGLPIQTTSTVTAVGITSTGASSISGATTLSGSTTASGGFTIGSTATQFTNVSAGFCYFAPASRTIAASSTVIVDCQKTQGWDASGISALTGVRVGDKILVSLSTTTAGSAFSGIQIIGASASTTAGYISITLSNGTGATFTWPTSGIASGTASYFDFR